MIEAAHEPPDPDDTAQQGRGGRRAIQQGDVYWVAVEEADGVGAGVPHPQVVIQADVLNRSRIQTVVVCALTSNIKRAKAPGNVLLEPGEANLPRQSVVEVTKVSTVEKTRLGAYLGSLSEERVEQILAGMRFVQSMTAPRDSA